MAGIQWLQDVISLAGFFLATLLLTAPEAAFSQEQAQAARPEGSRIDLTVGKLFVPQGFVATDGKVALIVHLHGSAAAAEKSLIRSNSKAVLVSVMLNGLSAVYTKQFADQQVWNRLLSETVQQLKVLRIADEVSVNRVTVVSFSAGFGGVRELLKDDAIYRRIDAIVMADSIYAGYQSGSNPAKVEPLQMTGFLKFARDAATGKKDLVISHCDLRPDGYASTAETADYLISELGLQREAVEAEWDADWNHRTQCVKNGFQVHGFAGDTGRHHMQHLRGAWRLIQLAATGKPAK